MRVPKSLRTVLRLVISAGLLYYILSKIPVDQLTSILRGIDPWPFLASLALTPVMTWLTATQTRILTDQQGLTLSTGQIFTVTFSTAFYGLLLPGALVGGAVRWYKFSQQDSKPAEALAAIVFGRLLNMLVLAVTGLACWALDAEGRRNPWNGAILAVTVAVMLGVWFLFFRRRQAIALASLIERFQLVPAIARTKLAKLLRAAADFHSIPPGTLLGMSATLTLYHLIGIFSFWLLAQAIPIGLSFGNVGWIRTYVVFLMALPISILGLGVREGALILLLQAYGVAPPVAVAYSFLLLARTLFTALIGGVIELVQFLRPSKATVTP